MTVTSTNYSTLEEVWGESFGPASRTKKEKRKKVPDPICELYEQGNNNGYTENDLVSYANSYFEKYDKYDKSKYSKSMNDSNDVLPHPARERPMRRVEISAQHRDYDLTDEDNERAHVKEQYEAYMPTPSTSRSESARPSIQTIKRHVIDEDDEHSSNSGFAFIDLLLYIVSGIILIFVMEQFVKIGLLLQ